MSPTDDAARALLIRRPTVPNMKNENGERVRKAAYFLYFLSAVGLVRCRSAILQPTLGRWQS
ncbi:hypothetical protein [Streptomyces sp. HSG2]|uniref:hypothetical protein n=1 Tax=Streptomyces sp. HSG2 TaxID=2797167 RepID=UPI001908A0C9|nr:hypothetical protein [Streptomyces sp. HSG2]